MKFILTLIFSFQAFLMMGNNVPSIYAAYTRQLQINNPAYYGLSLMLKSPHSAAEMSAQSVYSRNLDNLYTSNFPIFYNGGNYGCIGYDGTSFKTDANTQNLSLNFRNSINKSLMVGYGMNINRFDMDRNSFGTGTNVGLSLIAPSQKGGYLSFGLNFKTANFSYTYTSLDGKVQNRNEFTTNFDLGIAYLSANRRFTAGLSYFNFNERFLGVIESTGGGWGGSGSYMILPFSRTFILNIGKVSRLVKSGKLNLHSNIQIQSSNQYFFEFGDMLAHLEVKKNFDNGRTFGIGILNTSFLMSNLLGPNISIGVKNLEIRYSYLNTTFNRYMSENGIHSLNLILTRN